MTLIEEAKTAMLELADLTEGIARGEPPDINSVLGYQARMLKYHCLLGEQMARTFGAKERAYISRKVAQAEQHAHGRIQLKMTSKDSEERALREVRQQYEEEIQKMEEFELLRVFLRSLQNAFEHARSTVSFLKSQEKNPSEQ